jgi:hypothetical protein
MQWIVLKGFIDWLWDRGAFQMERLACREYLEGRLGGG